MTDYNTITELAGDDVSEEQVLRICQRYYWAKNYCQNKDVVEVACGNGQGLGYLSEFAKSVCAGDIMDSFVDHVKALYGKKFEITKYDAINMPYDDSSKDVILIFEALYYIKDVNAFFEECKRVLRNTGKLLIVTANKDLFDFNPSPFSHDYLGTVELNKQLGLHGFNVNCFGYFPLSNATIKQKILRPVKTIASKFGLIPKSMNGKKFLKKFVFGDLIKMPATISKDTYTYEPPTQISTDIPCVNYKVIYCEASLN
jgi:SAM-dependent methyltransferase